MASGVNSSLKSVATITAEAESFDFFVERPLKSWLHSARVLQSQATTCEREGDIQLAYLYTYRHAILVLEKLRQYPAAERAKHKDELSRATQLVNRNFVKLEAWKTKLQESYEHAFNAAKAYKAVANREARDFVQHREASPAFGDGFENEQRRSIDAVEYRQLALDLSEQELQRRSRSTAAETSDELSQQMRNTRRLLDRQTTNSTGDNAAGKATSRYNYPHVPHRPATSSDSLPPLVPSKVAKDPFSAPERPQKELANGPAVKFKIKAYTEGGVGLRSVMLPTALQQRFLNLAHPNTERNLETCGVLCASLVSNALIITHLVIPGQTSTSDTCDTTDSGDAALFDYCDQQDLLVCGWIHTHPTQTCFLSSRDLHTSSGYQQMLPEAIAIVCAPRHNPSLGVFRLTSPPGLPAVLKCQKPGIFHPHEEQNLYTDATAPGHVIEDPSLAFKVVDLRGS